MDCLGVRSVGFRIGWTRASGTLRRQTMTSAPCSTRARYSETRALNSAIFTVLLTAINMANVAAPFKNWLLRRQFFDSRSGYSQWRNR